MTVTRVVTDGSRARPADCHSRAEAGIDATNAGSIALHEALGFEKVGLLPQVGFKFGRCLEFLFMPKMLA